jgi:hypothetical protein
MMLVISVIVAIAILGILLGFIGGIGTFGSNAKTVMPDLLKKVTQRGYGLEVKDKVEFGAGDRIYPADVVGESPVAASSVGFACKSSDPVCSGTDKPLTVSADKIVVDAKISAGIVVCKSTKTTGKKYYVCVGSDAASATAHCESSSQCDLT